MIDLESGFISFICANHLLKLYLPLLSKNVIKLLFCITPVVFHSFLVLMSIIGIPDNVNSLILSLFTSIISANNVL